MQAKLELYVRRLTETFDFAFQLARLHYILVFTTCEAFGNSVVLAVAQRLNSHRMQNIALDEMQK